MIFFSFIACALSFGFFAARRLLTLLHFYQQEEYDSPRFLRWLWTRRAFDVKATAGIVLIALAGVSLSMTFTLLYVPFLVWRAWREKDPRKSAKKKLVMTARARRIYLIALLLALSAFAGLVALLYPFGAQDVAYAMGIFVMLVLPFYLVIPIQIMPLFPVIANALLAPFERRAQERYRAEAIRKLQDLKPFVIGITGSYGKTSVKHILGHILQSAAPTLITPGSVNTPMGITRIVREQLEARHTYFVVEMGAYGPGSIARLCAITPPDMGIVTAIGPAHYERFKSLEAVAHTKFELPAAAAVRGGKTVLHDTVLAHAPARTAFDANPKGFILCGESADAAMRILAVRQQSDGLAVDVSWRGEAFALHAPLYGTHHAANMAMAFAAACTLGVPSDHAAAALRSVPQIAHRLEVKPWRTRGLLIDDAYNSNPKGFESALELLDTLGRMRGARRILVTPGMVELGDTHDAEHARLGALAAQKADIALVVSADRIAAFVRAFRAGASSPDNLIAVADFAASQNWLAAHGREDDIVLLENDLPDLFENPPRF